MIPARKNVKIHYIVAFIHHIALAGLFFFCYNIRMICTLARFSININKEKVKGDYYGRIEKNEC